MSARHRAPGRPTRLRRALTLALDLIPGATLLLVGGFFVGASLDQWIW